MAGIAASTITIAGTGFVTGDVAYLYTVSTGVATPLTTHVTSLTQLTADVPANLALSDTLITVNDSSNSRRIGALAVASHQQRGRADRGTQ